MKRMWSGIVLMLCLFCACARAAENPAAVTTNADSDPIAPGKFIPTFTILYAGAKSEAVLKEAAQFDLIDAGIHAASDVHTWPMVKKLNPNLKVFTYLMGPGEYNTWVDFKPGENWDWMMANHGSKSADRWTAVGTKGDYLQNGKDRLMVIGNPAWQQYWLEGVDQFWEATSANRDTDGVYADNTDYEWPSYDLWHPQSHNDQTDVPADYYRDGVEDTEIYKKQAKAFFDRAVPWLADRHRLLIPNFGYMSKDPESWHDLDSRPHPVFGAMEEGAFATPWGVKGQFTFLPESGWLNQVKAMRQLQHVRALMSVHGLIDSPKPDLSRMDVPDVGGANRGWDVLWFGLTSFLQGYDDVRQNAYFGFTVWSYNIKAFWFDEFDPAHLNLGRALGESQRVNASTGHCYLREFDAGWVVVNPTDSVAQGIAVPQGQARVLDHYTFEHSDAQPLVAQFDLAAHRGVVLLKAGHHVGNAG